MLVKLCKTAAKSDAQCYAAAPVVNTPLPLVFSLPSIAVYTVSVAGGSESGESRDFIALH
jgi:hypothetical protein